MSEALETVIKEDAKNDNILQYITRCQDNRKIFQKVQYIVLEIILMMRFI